MLDRWGIEQPCHGPRCTHSHHTREAVDALVRDGVLKYLGRGRTVACWTAGTPDRSGIRNWRGKLSATVKTMQLVTGLAGRMVPFSQRTQIADF